MKTLLTIFSFFLLACSHEKNAGSQVARTDSTKPYTTEDTVFIATQNGDTLVYLKDDYNDIIDKHPELYEGFTYNPDFQYYCHGSSGFSSEVEKDNYYVLYAHFLKDKHKGKGVDGRRDTLTRLYKLINLIYSDLGHSGTFFGHQQDRIMGYVEFAINIHIKSGIEKGYTIGKQKDLFIKSLRQLIKDEHETDLEVHPDEKPYRLKGLNQIVDEIEKLITDLFYLRWTQDFHYTHYLYL